MPLSTANLPPEALEWIFSTIPSNSSIFELGSGEGTRALAEKYRVTSAEHDLKWLGIAERAQYIYVPIKGKWYDANILRACRPKRYHLLIVDGPPGTIGRTSFVTHRALFSSKVPWLFDDTQREAERTMVLALEKITKRRLEFFSCAKKRNFAVLHGKTA